MKKVLIWFVGIVMGVCCVALLIVQLSFFDTVADLREQQFEEGVRRSLYQVSVQLEQEEMNRIISEELQRSRSQAELMQKYLTLGAADETLMYDPDDMLRVNEGNLGMRKGHEDDMPLHVLRMKDHASHRMNIERVNSLNRDLIKRMYQYEHDVLDRAIFEAVFNFSVPVEQRVDLAVLEGKVRDQLLHNGIDIPFQLVLVSSANDTLLDTGSVSDGSLDVVYREPLFRNDLSNKPAVIAVSFPSSMLNNYFRSSVKFMLPSLLFSFVMLITFAVTLYLAIRHKRITKMKNDFVNNMTHEFKTPISTISLASQMLQDASVSKSPETISRLSGVIAGETKRLRFQVDKVLQISMFDDKNNAALKMKELDANELVAGIVSTFAVKAEQGGGSIVSSLDAADPFVFVDEMHFTNVVFNLMDNAIKYKRPDLPVELEVRTWNSGGKFCLSVKDNGIGIEKEHLKKIFDRFYRVTSGNVHDVKGFGLGLAYVKQVVRAHGGTIKAESDPGNGTTFVIVLPLK